VPRFAYVDGRFVRHRDGAVHIEDRGLQFGDAVYEVWAVRDGILFDSAGHLARLARSLAALAIKAPVSDATLQVIVSELIARNKLRDGLVYLQISRGVARRDHPFPANAYPFIILTARRLDMAAGDAKAAMGIKVQSQPDIRWGRVDIKTVNLLPNVLAKQAALEAGYHDAWLVDREGMVSEGTAQNAWIVDQNGVLRTRPTGHDILSGITRETIIAVAAELGFAFEDRAFSLAEAKAAREAFITSATSFVTPVIQIDTTAIANANPGPIATRLREGYLARNLRHLAPALRAPQHSTQTN
jgi:D-alanine transaminase